MSGGGFLVAGFGIFLFVAIVVGASTYEYYQYKEQLPSVEHKVLSETTPSTTEQQKMEIINRKCALYSSKIEMCKADLYKKLILEGD